MCCIVSRYHSARRAKSALQLMQKTGQIERTIDSHFSEEEAKYRTYGFPLLFVDIDLTSSG